MKRALKIDPNYKNAHNSMGSALKQFREVLRSHLMFKKAITIDQDYIIPYINLSFALSEMGELMRTFKFAKRDLKSTPNVQNCTTVWAVLLRSWGTTRKQ